MTMGALDGIRVVDLTSALAGPFCTMMLGDAGADVIKVEPPGGDSTRGWGPPFWGDQGAEFLAVNRNKRSIVLNLKKPEAREALFELCKTADVFVENYRRGVPQRLGIDYETLRAINPRHNPTQATLDRLLKPFGLRLSLAPIKGKPRRSAA